MEDVTTRFARRLREIREGKAMTQDQLATAAGNMSRAFVGAMERGEKAPGLETMARLAVALRIDVVELLEAGSASKANPGTNSPQEKLGRTIEAMAAGASTGALRKFERIAKAYFSKEDQG